MQERGWMSMEGKRLAEEIEELQMDFQTEKKKFRAEMAMPEKETGRDHAPADDGIVRQKICRYNIFFLANSIHNLCKAL
jgi:hypothetical protein